jgi:hypothetical protein
MAPSCGHRLAPLCTVFREHRRQRELVADATLERKLVAGQELP